MKHILKISLLIIVGVFLFPDVSYASCTVTYGNHTMTSEGYMVTGVYKFPGYERGGKKYDIVLNTYGDSRNNARYTVYNKCWTEAQINSAGGWAFWTFVDAFFAQSNNVWTHNPGCGNTHTFTRTLIATPVNGACAVSKNSCSSGTLGTTGETSSNFTWSCAGAHGGTTAQCTLGKDGRGGGSNSGGSNTTPTTPTPVVVDPAFEPVCTLPERTALADGEDQLIFSVFDRTTRSSYGYAFNWSKTSILADAVLNGSDNTAAILKSSDPVKFTVGDVSVTASAPGLPSKTAICPGGSFIEGINLRFERPIVEGDSCRLYWDAFESGTTCQIFNEKGVVGEVVAPGDTSRDVPANSTYNLKCEEMGVDENDLPTVVGEFETPYVTCIRRGELTEI